jgi:hypothetical protein
MIAALAQTLQPALGVMADGVAVAPTVVVAAAPTLDLTGIAVACIAGLFGVLGPVALYMVQSHVKDVQAAAVLAAAVKNSLGAAQQALDGVASVLPPVRVPAGIPPQLVVPLQYVLNHAGDEAGRLGITPQAIADKIVAQKGLVQIAAAVPNVPISAIVGPKP